MNCRSFGGIGSVKPPLSCGGSYLPSATCEASTDGEGEEVRCFVTRRNEECVGTLWVDLAVLARERKAVAAVPLLEPESKMNSRLFDVHTAQ